MVNVLTREELLKANNAFQCIDWKENIQEILDSTNDETILIEDKYIALIKYKATWCQIMFCKDLNLDLNMNLPQETTEWILEKIKSCEVFVDERFSFYKENGKIVFYLDSKTKQFWFDYHKIYLILEKKYYLKYYEIKELLNGIFKEHFKLEEYMVCIGGHIVLRNLDEHFELYGYQL